MEEAMSMLHFGLGSSVRLLDGFTQKRPSVRVVNVLASHQ